MTADKWEVARCLQRPKGSRNGKSQAIENSVRTAVQRFHPECILTTTDMLSTLNWETYHRHHG